MIWKWRPIQMAIKWLVKINLYTILNFFFKFNVFFPGNVTKLNVTTDIIYTTSVVLKWSPFAHFDTRTLLGYVVYYLEAPYKNVSLYDGRDACGGDG